ncbi:Sperm flagellar protein 2 [Echinococcus granulosus]|nr:Sperm flagellar protein 2 [Echinococcus granulosus]
MKATSELDKILTALIFLNKSKVKNKVDFQIRGAILRRPYCENPKFASSQDYEVIRLRDLYHNWPLKNNMEQSVSAIIKAELCNYDPSVNWFLEDCPINLGILKAMHATLHFNAILFISVPNEEIISQAVEGHWDNDEVVLELSHSDHALSSIRSFFHEKGCQIYEVKSAFGESIDAQISQLIKDHLVGLRKLEQQMETVECRTDYKADNEENLFITYCASKISQDMLKRFSEILEAISATFVDQLQKVLSKLRHQRLNIVEHLCECRRTLLTYLRRPSNRQALVDSWQKELNAMPLELLEDDVTKAERHLRLHELVFQLRELTEERRDDNLTHLRDFVGHNEWHANERTNLMNNYCLLLQIELDRWQDRNRVVEMFFPSTDDTNEGKLEDQRNQNYYRLPMLKPPGLFTTEQSLSQTADLKAKRRQPPKDELSESKVQTITYTTEDFKTDDETDRPQLLFVTSATLTACEMLPLTHEDATAKAKEVKKVKQSLEKKKAGEKAQRSRGKKDLTPPQPNQYLLGSQLKPKEPELAFLYEIATCALKVVQLRLTEEQTKLGMYVDDNGDPLPCKEELPKSQDTTSSRSTKTVKKVKKTAPTPELIKEPEQSEKPKVEKAIRLNLLKDEAERTALRLQLIRDVGLEILATFQGDVVHFQNEGTQWIDAEYRGFQKSITKLEEYVQEKIERGESLEYRLLIADNDPFYVSQEVVFTPQRLVNLHPFDQVIDGSPQPENDSFGNLSKLVDQFRREAPHGCICEKLFVELMTDKWECDPMELAKAFIVPQGTKSTGLSVVSSVDWRRFIVAAAMRMLNSSSDQMWESLSVLRRTVHEMAKSTLVGLRLPTEEVKKITSSEGVKLDSRVWDLLLSLFEAPGEEGQMVEMDDLMLSLAASGYSSPFDSLVRSLAALQTPALPLPTPQTTQALHNLFNYPEAGQKPKEDFKVSKEVVQKIMDYVQTFIGSKGCFPSDTRLREMELKEAFGGARSTETPIHLLLHQSQFRALSEDTIGTVSN